MARTRSTAKGLGTSTRSYRDEKTAERSTRHHKLVAMTAPRPCSSSSSSSSLLPSRAKGTKSSAAVDSASDHDDATHDDLSVTNTKDATDVEQDIEEPAPKDDKRWKTNTVSARRWRLAQARLREQAAQRKAERQTPEEAAREAAVRQARQNEATENHLRVSNGSHHCLIPSDINRDGQRWLTIHS